MDKEIALKILRELHDKALFSVRTALETFIPELKESEDEKIRKAILAFVRQSSEVLDKQNQNNMIAWLEKQREQTISENYKQAEKEKRDAVGYGFMLCKGDILDFKEGESYWLEYIGDDKYNVRSDNLLGKTYHLTPMQFYLCFRPLTWLEKQGNHNEQNFWEKCKCCEYFDNYDMCLHNKNFGAVTDESKENCRKSNLFIEKQNKQNTDGKTEPKFKVGDIVQYITDSTDRRKIEEVDTLCNMYHTDSSPIMFEIEDEWKVVVNAEDVEQKPSDTVEPKFKVGDWIVNKSHDICLITEIDLENIYYICESNRFGNTDGDIDLTDKAFHLWTIQDAKDGDVLVNGDEIVIFKKNSFNEKDLRGSMFVYCSLRNKKGYWYTIGGINPSNYVPATKKQQDLLFSKMKEKGYEWDAEKKELRKIEQEQVIDYLVNLTKDNWEFVHEFVEKFGRIPKDEDELNVLVEYVLKRQKPSTWSEKDDRIRKELLESFKYQQRESRTDKEWLNGIKLSEVVAWLEKQSEQQY